MKKILISGGSGNLATAIRNNNTEYELICPNRQELDICSRESITSYLDTHTPDIFIHAAALTRPMLKHTADPDISIETNIIGTSNIVIECLRRSIKLIYISTDYVYPGVDGNYSEKDTLLPVNEYGWSKLGGECAVMLYKNSLILRMALCQQPFPHLKALIDIKKSYLYMDDAAKIILKIINEVGIINIGGDAMSPYEFISKDTPDIERITLSEIHDITMGKDSSMNISKMKNILNDTTI